MNLNLKVVINILRSTKLTQNGKGCFCDLFGKFLDNKLTSWATVSPEFNNRKQLWLHFKSCNLCWSRIKAIKESGNLIDIVTRYIINSSANGHSDNNLQIS